MSFAVYLTGDGNLIGAIPETSSINDRWPLFDGFVVFVTAPNAMAAIRQAEMAIEDKGVTDMIIDEYAPHMVRAE